jgi:hypothetical protein
VDRELPAVSSGCVVAVPGVWLCAKDKLGVSIEGAIDGLKVYRVGPPTGLVAAS